MGYCRMVQAGDRKGRSHHFRWSEHQGLWVCRHCGHTRTMEEAANGQRSQGV